MTRIMLLRSAACAKPDGRRQTMLKYINLSESVSTVTVGIVYAVDEVK